MNWIRLSENKSTVISRGSLIKFTASYPFENEVIMMVCEAPHSRSSLGLITITGYKAGINCYVVFPDAARSDEAAICNQWLYDNWQHWVWPESSPDDIFILPEGLSAGDLK